MGELIPLVVIPVVFGTVSWVLYSLIQLFVTRQRIRATADIQAKLIDRLSGDDMRAFLGSGNGNQLLRSLAEQPAADDASLRILRAMHGGFVLLALGIGLFIYPMARSLPERGADGVTFFATIAVAVGVGLLAAAAASYLLSQRLGLLARDASQ